MKLQKYFQFIRESFNEDKLLSFYDDEWKILLPKNMTLLYKDEIHHFTKGNIMLNGDLVQITYDNIEGDRFGSPDTLEFDLYFVTDVETGNKRVDIDITYGDFMACEFSIESPNKVKVIQHTTYHSKFDTSNTVFALDNKSLQEFVDFLNRIPGMKLTTYDLRFLDELDNYIE
jgi:hypothetical protein